jgi:hypothetical protein
MIVKHRRILTPQNPNRSIAYDADRRSDPTPIHSLTTLGAADAMRSNLASRASIVQAAALAPVGTVEMAFRTCEAIW